MRLKRPLCFGHSIIFPYDQAIGKVGVAVRADSVGGVEPALLVAVKCVASSGHGQSGSVCAARSARAQALTQPAVSGLESENVRTCILAGSGG